MTVLVYGRNGAALEGAALILRQQGMRVGLRSSIDCRRVEHVEACEFAVVVDGNSKCERALREAGVTVRYLASTGRLLNSKPGRKPKRRGA